MRQQLQVDVGGTVRFTPPTMDRPSSPTVSIVDVGGTELEAPAASVDSVNTTLSAEAAAAAESITLTSVTGLVARRHYVLAGADGEREWVRVRSINSATKVVTLYEPLVSDYPVGAAFYGTELSAPVAAESAATLAEGYEARWTYTAGGEEHTGTTRWDVVHTAWPAQITTTQALRSYAGQLVGRDLQRPGNADFEDVLDHAFERVLEDIRARGRDPSRFRSIDAWQRVVHEAALLHLAEQADVLPASYRDQPTEWLRLRRERYDEVMSVTLSAAKDYDADQSGTVSAGEAAVAGQVMRLQL